MKTYRMACAVLAAAFLLNLSAGSSDAQTRDVAFVHGWNAGPGVWNDYRSTLSDRFDIRDRAPGWPMDRPIAQSASQYIAPSLPNGSIVVAHSAGGVLSREIYRNVPGGRQKVAGLITVGTPHLGAPFRQGAFAYAPDLVELWAGDAVIPWALLLGGQAGAGVVSGLLNDLGTMLDLFLTMYQLIDPNFPDPVATDLDVGSPFMSQLNSSPSASLPAARYAVYGDEDWLTFLRMWESFADADNQEEGEYAGNLVRLVYLYDALSYHFALDADYLWDRYLDTFDPVYYFESIRAASVAQAFYSGAYSMAFYWQTEYSALIVGNGQFTAQDQVSGSGVFDTAAHDDGFIPIGSQAPRSYFTQNQILRAEGASHIEEFAGPASLEQIDIALRGLGVDPRSGGGGTPPPPPNPGPGPGGDGCDLRLAPRYDTDGSFIPPPPCEEGGGEDNP